MKGQKEDIQSNDEGNIIVVNRGKKGAAIANIATHADFVDVPTNLSDGIYHDIVYGKEFKVKKGRLLGIAAGERSYILRKK